MESKGPADTLRICRMILNTRILHMFEGTFWLEAVHFVININTFCNLRVSFLTKAYDKVVKQIIIKYHFQQFNVL